jgi:phosphoglucosamine mutase
VPRALRAAEAPLDGSGRVLVRYSGTQPLARVMVEGEDEQQIRELAASVAAALQAAVGDV